MTPRPRRRLGLLGPAMNAKANGAVQHPPKTRLKPRPQPIAKKRPIEAHFDPPETSDFRARAVEQLAKHLAAAYLAYAMDLNFPEAMRYVLRQSRAGDLWTAAARFIFGAQSLIDRAYGR